MTGRWERQAREAAAHVLADDPQRLDVVVLAIRETREVYACGAPSGRVVAKYYDDPAIAEASYRALDRVGGRHGAVLAPRCLRYDAERQVIVQDHLTGGSFFPLLEGAEAPGAVRRAGRALAGLHGLPGRLPARLPRAAVIAQARAAMVDVAAEDLPRATAALAWAERSLRELPEMPDVVCHGDFGWAQLLDCDGAVGVVDFDRAAEGEPAFDLGNLVAQLLRRRGPAGRPLVDPLIEEYELHAGRAVREIVLPYAALVLVRKLGRLRHEERPWLRAALSALQDGRYGA